ARNLHKAAKVVIEQHHGELPRDLESLRKLPGIGRYTAGAIASMAFGLDEPTLDGNIRRVLARVFDVSEPAESPAAEKILWALVAEHLPKGEAANYNQALMDLGAIICLPKYPRCLICPLMKICRARQLGIQEQRPVLKPKKETPHYVHVATVILRRGRVLLTKRPSKGLLGGMWEFPNARVDGDPAKELVKAIQAATRIKVKRKDALGLVKHSYSHFSVTVHAFRAELVSMSKNENLKWVRVGELEDFPMGRIDRQIARQLG
ncbi:MAG: A/G-specific adenine glycosylase, partial [Chloroflexi bacterium]|nr:A/G-specific adenine glycosylase [Chloroflexota bacterium]